jgi:DNA-binding transcriptional ArsR family regulator
MTERATAGKDRFFAIGDQNRRHILELLSVSDRSVGELAGELGITQPSTSQHLALLREVGLVDFTKHGNSSIYRIVPGALGSVTEWIESL